MKIDKLINEKNKDKEFKEYYELEGEKLETAIALYKAREAAGLTQEEVAEKSNVTQATIARIERGDNVSFEKLASIANALGKKLHVSIS